MVLLELVKFLLISLIVLYISLVAICWEDILKNRLSKFLIALYFFKETFVFFNNVIWIDVSDVCFLVQNIVLASIIVHLLVRLLFYPFLILILNNIQLLLFTILNLQLDLLLFFYALKPLLYYYNWIIVQYFFAANVFT